MTNCNHCTLFTCDITSQLCLLKPNEVAKVRPDLVLGLNRIREQKRLYQIRVREKRRAEIPYLRLMFSKMLSEYGTFGKHSEVMRKVKAQIGAK